MTDTNQLLTSYALEVEHPHASGAEHHHMLFGRDLLNERLTELDARQRQILADADRRLVDQATIFLAEINEFIDLAEERRRRSIPSDRWWWYLDVITHLPNSEPSVTRRTA